MKVIIIGGGIGGLSAYVALRHFLSEFDISTEVYEAHTSPSSTVSIIGGGLGLAPNGLRALASFAPKVAARIHDGACHTPYMTFRNSRGDLVGRLRTGAEKRYGFDQVFCSRAAVHEALLAEVGDGVVQWGKRATEVKQCENMVDVAFEDSSMVSADLVIGADGVRSIVREAVVGTGYPAEYDGLIGIAGLLPASALPAALQSSLDKDPLTMTFGAQGFFGYGPTQPPGSPDREIMWWSTFETSNPPGRNTPLAAIRAQLVERHASWRSPYDDTQKAGLFPSLIDSVCGPPGPDDQATASSRGVLVLPRYHTKRLPTWSTQDGRILLLGDSAHAMPPDSGQGMSCAVEDAVVISLLLKHYLRAQSKDTEKGNIILASVAGDYNAIRRPRVRKILDYAERFGSKKRQSKMTWWGEWLRDRMLWVVSKLPESMNDSLFAYDADSEVKRYLAERT